jgi:hypothetical protein
MTLSNTYLRVRNGINFSEHLRQRRVCLDGQSYSHSMVPGGLDVMS